MKKFLCLLFTVALLITAIPFQLIINAVEKIDYSVEVTRNTYTPDVNLFGDYTGVLPVAKKDVIGMQINFTAPVKSIAIPVPSFNNNTGSATIAIFAFDTDYDTSLLSEPIAKHTFVDFLDGAHLTFVFSDSTPLPAGEYIVICYDMYDDTPTANGGSAHGIGMWMHASHESQRTYVNGAYVNDKSFCVSAKYVSTPTKKYNLPTKPAVSEDIDLSPHMKAVIDFSKSEYQQCFGGTNQMKASMEDGFVRFKADTDAGDPFIFINFPDTMIKCNEYKIALIKMRRSENSPTNSQIFFLTDETGISEAASVRPTYKDTTDWQYLIVNLGSNSNYTGLLKTIRFDIFTSSPGSNYVDVAYIALFKTHDAAAAFHDNFEDFEEAGSGGENEDNSLKPDYSTYIGADAPGQKIDGKLTPNGQLGYLYKEYPFEMDFSKSVEKFINEGRFSFTSVDNAMVKDGKLYCKAFSSYSFFTKFTLGDKYGIRGGAFEMDLSLSDGKATFIVRQMQPKDDPFYSGITFELTPDGKVSVASRDGFKDSFSIGVDLSAEHRIAIIDSCDSISFTVDGNEVYKLLWDSNDRMLSVDGKENSGVLCIHIPNAGYAEFRAERTRGTVDNVKYTYIDIIQKDITGTHDIDYSTWVATDDLNRTTPTNTETGDKNGKYVGLFYFLIHSDDMTSRYVNDVTRFYLEGGVSKVSSKLSSFAGRNGAYWAEPYFGYYSSHDEWVYRKHAYMLDAAGVDFIFLDVSNNRFYVDQCKILFDTWKAIRDEGGHTPQIAFMYGDMPYTLLNGLYTLLDPFYNNPDYKDLLFCWEGKPLLLGNSDTPDKRPWTVSSTTPQTQAQYKQYLNQNPEVKEFYTNQYKDLLKNNFTVRKCWAWQAGTYAGYWDWLQESPQALGTNADGKIEQISVSMGVHAHTNRGRSYVNGDNAYNKNGDFGFSLGTAQYGKFFSEQFDYALTQEVDMVMITGWNEWYAGVQSTSNQNQTCGQTSTPGYYMVDQMSPEYSRDGEPMRLRDGVGFGDNYYYQMVSYIRRFKGLDAAPNTVNGGSLSTAAPAEWDKVGPAFTDIVGDTDLRHFASFTSEFMYINGTVRNDLNVAKVSQDSDHMYFHISTATPLITVDDELWMNLYIDADNNSETGWEGFDYVINRSRTDKTVKVEKFVDGKWEFADAGEGEYTLDEYTMTIKVKKSVLGGKSGELMSVRFKWADNANVEGDIMRFMELGDTAPNDRFMFEYVANSMEDDRNKPDETESVSEEETETETETESESESEIATETKAEETTIPEEETKDNSQKGCKSSVASVGSLLVCSALSGAVGMKFCQSSKRKAKKK